MIKGIDPGGFTIKRAASQLTCVDIQTRLSGAMQTPERVIGRAEVLLKAAEILAVPVLISEQYPKGLGATEPAILAAAPSAIVLEKTEFSCARNDAISNAIGELVKDFCTQIIICGMETHVCVAQTALDLAAAGHDVFVVSDAVTSRRQSDIDAALARFRHCGVHVVTSEMVIFEWLETARSVEFKAISELIRPL